MSLKVITLVGVLVCLNALEIASQGQCFKEHNAERSRNGRPPLRYNAQLERAAQGHSDLMARTNCFSHQCPGEPNFSQRISNAGYRWRGVAENIASGQRDCKHVMESWMNSPGHKKNILGDYQDVGCARQGNFWTCNFGTPA